MKKSWRKDRKVYLCGADNVCSAIYYMKQSLLIKISVLLCSLFCVMYCLAEGEKGSALNSFTESDQAQVWERYAAESNAAERGGLIYIDKQRMTLSLFNTLGKVVFHAPMACGKNYGHKQRSGDMRTPEGLFQVQQIQKSDYWVHDFGDGKGVIEGAYGPYFIRLKTGFKGIGIHGTHAPNSIGTRATEGCIRLRNEDVERLRPLVVIGMPVVITVDRKK